MKVYIDHRHIAREVLPEMTEEEYIAAYGELFMSQCIEVDAEDVDDCLGLFYDSNQGDFVDDAEWFARYPAPEPEIPTNPGVDNEMVVALGKTVDDLGEAMNLLLEGLK